MAPFRIERFSVKSFLDAMKGFLDKVTFVVGCFAGLLIFCCGMKMHLRKNKGACVMATIIGCLLFGFWFFQALFKASK